MIQKIFLNKNFFLLLISQFLSKIGDYAHEILFVLLIIELSNSNYLLIGFTYFIRFIPYIIAGPIGGTISDIYSRKKIMIISDVLRFILCIILYFLYTKNFLNMYYLIISSFLFTFFRVFFQPACQALIPLTVKKHQLLKANSLTQISTELSIVIGPILCAYLIKINLKSSILLIDSITYLFSIIILLFVKEKSEYFNKFSINLNDIYKKSYTYFLAIKKTKPLFNVILYSGICILFTSSLLRFVLPGHILIISNHKEEFVGYVISSIAVGTVIGSIIFSKIKNAINEIDIMKYWIVYGSTFLIISISKDINFLIFISFILGYIGSFVDIGIVSFIQTNSNNNEIGKNFSIFSTVANTGESISGLLSGIIAFFSINIIKTNYFIINTPFLIMSVMLLLTPLIGLIKYKTKIIHT